MLNVFTVREYRQRDLPQLIQVYQSAFAEPPWNETWSDEEVIADLESGLAQQDSIVLVAEANNLVGITWGYTIPMEKFPFLAGKVQDSASYMDEIAVDGNARLKGVGTALGEEYIKRANRQVVLRTDQRNEASMALFKKLGFKPIPEGTGFVFDPEFPERIYLEREKWR